MQLLFSLIAFSNSCPASFQVCGKQIYNTGTTSLLVKVLVTGNITKAKPTVKEQSTIKSGLEFYRIGTACINC